MMRRRTTNPAELATCNRNLMGVSVKFFLSFSQPQTPLFLRLMKLQKRRRRRQSHILIRVAQQLCKRLLSIRAADRAKGQRREHALAGIAACGAAQGDAVTVV